MKIKLWKYISPIIVGVLLYLILISINDVYRPDAERWERGWVVNGIEIVVVIVLAYLCILVAHFWEKRLRKTEATIGFKVILKEFLKVCFTSIVVLNLVGGSIFEIIDGYVLPDILLINTIPVIFTLFYYALIRGNFYIQKAIEGKVKLEKLENDKLTEELRFLKGQIHPHFLFNVLNTIYFQMDESVDSTKESIEKFSELLRYRLYDNEKEKLSLQQEYHYLENYIELEKLRHSKLDIRYEFDKAANNIQIYPFLMLPLVENAFKHMGGEMKIDIKSEVQNGAFYFVIENSKHSDSSMYKPSGGIGLANLKRRLELLYPKAHSFECKDLDNQYIAKLTITTNNA